VGLHVGLRPGDKKSSGIIPHLKTYDVDTLAFKQGTTRRGATAAYLQIDHPEIVEFLEMRKPTGGDPNRKCLNLHHGINITDKFMERVEKLSTDSTLTKAETEELDKWDLINQHTGLVTETVSVRDLWERMLTIRMETGEPYFWFIDTANEELPEFQKSMGLKNNGSNLCSEISLVTKDTSDGTPARTFVCCLSSLNLERYDEWKNDARFIADVVEMLDNVITVFIDKSETYEELSAARYAASQERSIGIGALGWHALLQKRGIPFESAMATGLNLQIWAKAEKEAKDATHNLALTRGPCPDWSHERTTEISVRNAHIFSVAPNASSSIILGTSPSIEPYRANVYLEKGVNGT
jgi:ribonucleoside-diphosphate reductase alpha chain